MKAKNYSIFYRTIAMSVVVLMLNACAGTSDSERNAPVETPTVDYVESLDVNSTSHNDSFLNTLAMNYRSYAIYNARTSGYSEMGEMFAQKAVAAFSGETPFPETIENWPVEEESVNFELYSAYNKLMEQLKNDASYDQPKLAAEAQAKYDCWLSSTASGQTDTAAECKIRFEKAMDALDNGGTIVASSNVAEEIQTEQQVVTSEKTTQEKYYTQTPSVRAAGMANRSREGIVIVNNVNVPANLINPVPVSTAARQGSSQPIIFNQHIYGGDKSIQTDGETLGDQSVSRDEFINMMMAMRTELQDINKRLDAIDKKVGEKAILKVQQIPLEPKQHVMEEIFEIRFDFNRAEIKPEYADVIRRLASATQTNKNIKVSVMGHTDTVGTDAYNYALGGKRAEAVEKMLVKYGIPSNQIVAVSAGEADNKIPTGDGVANANNRRVRVVKEVHYTQPGQTITPKVKWENYE